MLDHLCTDMPVTDLELLLHMIRRKVPFHQCPEKVQVPLAQLAEALWQQGPRQIGAALHSLPHTDIVRLISYQPLAAEVIRQRPGYFDDLPSSFKKLSFFAPILPRMQPDKHDELLRAIAATDTDLALSLAPLDEVIRCHPMTVLHLQPSEATAERRRIAVESQPRLLRRLHGKIDAREYQELCDRVLDTPRGQLAFIAESERTPERVDKALERGRVAHVQDIPGPLRTERRLRLALERSRVGDYAAGRNQLSCAFCTQWNLWDTLRDRHKWLAYLPEEERTEALCLAYVGDSIERAGSHFIPEAIRQRHPEWNARGWKGTDAIALEPESLCKGWSGAALARAIEDKSAVLHVLDPWPAAQDIAPWALLMEGFWDKLPAEYKELIWRKGGTEGLGPAFGVPDFDVDPQALLDPVQEHCCTLRASVIPEQVARKLMFCHHFQPRHQALGAVLRQKMTDLGKRQEQRLAAGTLPLWSAPCGVSDAAWTARGGRTLVHRDNNGRVVHMKFWRQGETLTTLAAEQAAQQFAHDHPALGWQSEIPQPQGIVRVPIDEMPADPESFADRLQVHEHQGQGYCLAFCFTTHNDDYDTLAWQPDTPGGECRKAREGLLRAFHDLGIWSSLGAVHTSTIKLYHHFYEVGGSRPDLLLDMFRYGQCYPGTLHLWNTESIEQSDWGRSGLRDLGDLEFYPFIATYVESADAHWILDGYGQRASFVNGMAQNLLGGLLHYLRACRDQPDYHYRNDQQINRLGQFLADACNGYLGTLLGDGTRLDTVIAGDVYPEWLYRTAQEMIYWTARQTEDTEGFGLHFNRDGRPCAQLYPGHPRLNVRYGKDEDFTEEAGESLGTDNGKLPLFYLMRGIYMMAALVADRLAAPDAPQPGAPPQEPMAS